MVYVTTSFIAWLVTVGLLLLLSIVLVKLGYPDVDKDNLVQNVLLYSSIGILTALFAAYRIDIPPHVFNLKLNRILWRLCGGIAQGFAMALVV